MAERTVRQRQRDRPALENGSKRWLERDGLGTGTPHEPFDVVIVDHADTTPVNLRHRIELHRRSANTSKASDAPVRHSSVFLSSPGPMHRTGNPLLRPT